MHCERRNDFQTAYYYIFSRKKIKKRYVCLLYLTFSDPLPETHLLFYIVLQATIMGNPDFDEEAEQAIADRLKEAMDGCGRVLHLNKGSYCPASQE